jgi:hypothetical protein
MDNNSLLIQSICEKETFDTSLKSTINDIGRRIIFHPSNSSNLNEQDNKVYDFTILTGEKYEGIEIHISIHVLKGSLMTHTWNNFSRYDDHYKITYKNADGVVFDIVHFSGLNQSTCSVQNGSCNWIKLREIMIYMNITSVGLCTFVTLLGHFLMTLPYFTQFGSYIVPMPATYM